MASPAQFLHREVLFLCLFFTSSSLWTSAQILTTLHSFNGTDGSGPDTVALAQGRDGNLYGTASIGGTSNNGTVFRLTQQGNLSAYSFDATHGEEPFSGLVLGLDGLLRGMTPFGGKFGDGVVFSIGPQAPIPAVFSFNSTDGRGPIGSLALGVDGNYYGTTPGGGAHNFGTVFRLTARGAEVFYSFNVVACPTASLVYGPDHAFYGVGVCGGAAEQGSIFRITQSGEFKTIYECDIQRLVCSGPQGLVLANDGNFYVTSYSGGQFNLGTIFRLDPTGNATVIYNFDGVQGSTPLAGLMQATDSKLYGTTDLAGTQNNGVIFSITTSGDYTVVYRFSGTDGSDPRSTLIQHTNGKLYGTTSSGGTSANCLGGCGTVFSLDMGLAPFITFVLPNGRVGSGVQILGQGLTGTTAVTFNGVPATTFNVSSDTFMEAIVPPGATTGPVQVTTPGGVLTSNVNLQIVP